MRITLMDYSVMNNEAQKQRQKIISLEEAFNIEIVKSERLRAIILIGILAIEALFLLLIYSFYQNEYLLMFKSHIAIYAILIFTSIMIVYESIVLYLLGNRSKFIFVHPKFFGYINSFSEVTLLSILLIFIVEYSDQTIILLAPAALTYFVFIVLSTLRLNFKLSIFTGSLAAIEYILISIYYSTYFTSVPVDAAHPDLSGMQYIGQGLIMIITGVAAGFVANLIKKKMSVSWKSIEEKNEVIDLFGQQISPQIADNILKNRNELSGAKKHVCIMFLDIRKFTPYVERHQPEEVVTYLNTLFGFMIDIVQSHHGVINQFLGDGFMATFGAPVSIGDIRQHATEASLEIISKMNSEIVKGSIPETRIGIGLHYDEAITGNIGSSIRKQYSITGRVVVMASRIEQLNKEINSQLLISKEVYNQLNSATQSVFTGIGTSNIKGSTRPVSLYKLEEMNSQVIKNRDYED
ncbi:MAG: adenylate/guanylate cyclase domain-containing protein [Bacteroidetes bacterium]|jgi:adenylate cyclase|nr:adenylate/guanylate cyclase domain-containing protein [Bacteroidota bacterium]MBT3749836.1 adenylate/guanylate cyclase domain-containing protein [Bacteroidota bacterium]MBT4401109.1 adenylate/guanylate cyclase domain-containing protein [Bacteroidota bacterium]MBT4410116.1 adenylate/guanylate cyclase domain-containing protein [Bacteroidota bacterium]MBT7095632.1 adenylate/guanylate cyclase domain-containing protein [Bacteroidota bacterium]